MKKIIIVFVTLFLCGCSAKKEDFYNLVYGSDTIIVGYDGLETIENLEYIDSYTTYIDRNDEEKLESIVIYPKDRPSDIFIDGFMINSSIENNCRLFSGELVNNNGKACVIHKTIKDKENYVILFGNILNDNEDELDRIEIYYK